VRWLVDEWHWPYAGAVAAVFLLAVLPLWWDATNAALGLTLASLPLYMLHQLEEHAGDRFRRTINERIAGGREALTRAATFWINALLIWGIDLAALWLAYFGDLAWGLVPVYVMGVNAVTHIAAAIGWRAYNPGLVTAVVGFVPFSVAAAIVISDESGAGAGWQAIALGVAVAAHVALVAYVVSRTRRLRAT
jgi:Protein of unknown function with HXXEE motif